MKNTRKLFTAAIICLCVIAQCEKKQSTPQVKVDEKAGTAQSSETSTNKPEVLRIMEEAFAKNNQVCTERLNRRLAGIDKNAYAKFVQSMSSPDLAGCTLDTSAVVTLISEYRGTADYSKKASLLEQIRTAANLSAGADENALRCLEKLTASVDEKGMFISGFQHGKNLQNENDVRITRPVEGWVMLINPQLAYAWPGEENSATSILQPTDAPFKVIAAETYYQEVTTHCQEWKGKELKLSQFLNTNNKTHLLVEFTDGNRGWVDMDSVAFLDKSFSGKMEKKICDFYLKGYAWYLHGVWQADDFFEHDASKGTMVAMTKGNMFHFDLLHFCTIAQQSSGIIKGAPFLSYYDTCSADPICSVEITTDTESPQLFITTLFHDDQHQTKSDIMIDKAGMPSIDGEKKYSFDQFYRN